MDFYTLLYIDEKHKSHVNMGASVENPIDVYIKCGINLSNSFRAVQGQGVSIITNNQEFLKQKIFEFGGDVNVIQVDFDRGVPENINFFAAHFKLDVIQAFGRGEFGEWVGLIDIDTVLIRPFPLDFKERSRNELFVYEITGSVTSEYGENVIVSDLKEIGADNIQKPVWYGGEFIAGNAEAFRILGGEVDAIWPHYVKAHHKLHHSGDEIVVTAALHNLQSRGALLVAGDVHAGTPFVSRWWTARTGSVQPRFSKAAAAALLHLPSDKPFLAKIAKEPFTAHSFLETYKRYAAQKLLFRRLANPFLCLIKRKRRYVGRL